MNASAQVIYWRDIPAQVRVRKGSERFSLPLSMRFQEAIDAAAVQSGLTGTDAYLEQWHNSPWQSYEGDPEEIAAMLVEDLENRYTSERLHSLINDKGIE